MKQLNNKILLIILIVLLGAFALTKVFRSPGRESNLQADLFETDTASVTEIRMHPPGGKEIKLLRTGTGWQVQQEGKKAEAAGGSVRSLLGSIADVDVQRMVSRQQGKWNEFKVGDTTGIHVEAYAGQQQLADFWIGEASNASGPYGSGLSYVRLQDENEVYSTEGYLVSRFDNTYDEWRDHTFLRLERDKISKISFRYPADTGFVAEKKAGGWMIGDMEADSARMGDYLDGLASKNIQGFADGFQASADPDAVITIEGEAGELATVKAWEEAEEWVLASSLRDSIYFSGKPSEIELLVGKAALLPEPEKTDESQ